MWNQNGYSCSVKAQASDATCEKRQINFFINLQSSCWLLIDATICLVVFPSKNFFAIFCQTKKIKTKRLKAKCGKYCQDLIWSLFVTLFGTAWKANNCKFMKKLWWHECNLLTKYLIDSYQLQLQVQLVAWGAQIFRFLSEFIRAVKPLLELIYVFGYIGSERILIYRTWFLLGISIWTL